MKRYNNLLTEDTVTLEFCERAITEAARGKKKREKVVRILRNKSIYAYKIQYMLLNDTFVPHAYGEEIRMEKGKERHLQKPTFYPDEVIHHAIIMLVRDKLLKRMDYYACASIPNRGQNRAIRALKSWVQDDVENTKYVLKCDIRKCFENIHPDMVIREFKKFIKDKRWLSVFEKIINSTDSLPLGNYMSAWILNTILKPLDYEMRNSKCTSHYVRYMDDFCIFSSSSKELLALIPKINSILGSMQLELKSNYQVYNVDKQGVDMVGFRFFRKAVLPRRRNLYALYRKINKDLHNPHVCRSILTRMGQLHYADSDTIYHIITSRVNLKLLRKTANKEG